MFGNIDIVKALGINEETAVSFLNQLFDHFENMEKLRFLMEREYGLSPDRIDWEQFRERVDRDMLTGDVANLQRDRNKVTGAWPANISDTADLQRGASNGVYLNEAGDLTLSLKEMNPDRDEKITWKNISPGIVHPLRIKRIWETGTDLTEDEIIILY